VELEKDFNLAAVLLIAKGRLEEARALLEAVVAERSAGWGPIVELPDEVVIYCWSPDEFSSYCAAHPGKNVGWVLGSYAQAYYWLAHIAAEREPWDEPLDCIVKGLEIEPDHPYFLCELGYVLGKLGMPAEALEAYRAGEQIRPWAPPGQKARAVRRQAVNLIDLGRLDEAEIELIRSLQLDPANPVALNELG